MNAILADSERLEGWFAGDPGYPPPELLDPLHQRLRDAVMAWRSQLAAETDVAVLLRHVMRRLAQARGLGGLKFSPQWDLSSEVLDRVHIDRSLVNDVSEWRSRPWRPAWLGCAQNMPDVDEAALAGLPMTARAVFLASGFHLPADGFYTAATGQSSYRSLGQRCAARAAVALEPGGTLIAALPTGSGKTEVAFAAVHEDCERGRVAVIVVPTVALALDLERRIRATLQTAWGFGPNVGSAPFAWHGGTDTFQRDLIIARISTGDQRLIVTSPESIMNAGVGRALRNIAKIGQLGWFIVDEAHIIRQWGRTFRPEFLELGRLAGELAESAQSEGHQPCRTLVMSATLTDEHIGDLRDQFTGNQPVRLVAANEMRPEPEMWTSGMLSLKRRDEALIECLMHLPRPAIVYATIPDEAERLVGLIQGSGMTRVAAFTGHTVGEERLEILEKFRGDDPEGTSVDVVVATSAFGLGVDYDPIRTVIHACVPETIDRWYQEIGRCGRDGYASVAVLLPAQGDIDIALGMGVRRLEVETFKTRWNFLKAGATRVSTQEVDWMVANLQITFGRARHGSYNKFWNAQILTGLEDLGYLTIRRVWHEDLGRYGLSPNVDNVPAEWIAFRPTSKVIPPDLGPDWEQWRELHLAEENCRVERVRTLESKVPGLCTLLGDAFKSGTTITSHHPAVVSTFWASHMCGRCPLCRAERLTVSRSISSNPNVEWCTPGPTPDVWAWSPERPLVLTADVGRHQEIVDFHIERGFQYLVAPGYVESPKGTRFRDLDATSLLGTVGCATVMVSDDPHAQDTFRDRALRYPSIPQVLVTSSEARSAQDRHSWPWDLYRPGSQQK